MERLSHIAVCAELASYWQRKDLIWALSKRDLFDRYAGQIIGRFWTLLNPLLLLCLYIFVFGYIFPVRLQLSNGLPRDFITYLMAGLIPWLSFTESLMKNCAVLRSNATFVQQLSFPTTILIIKTVVASIMGQLIASIILFVYIILTGGLSLGLLLLPIVLFFQCLAMAGFGLLFAAMGLYFRDLKDILSFYITANFFLIPMIYVPGSVPRIMEIGFSFNPFSYLIWCYQDVFYFGGVSDPKIWVIFALGSALTFVFGLKIYQKLEPRLGDML
jgi:lipopolysaccharide transport system permease protein